MIKTAGKAPVTEVSPCPFCGGMDNVEIETAVDEHQELHRARACRTCGTHYLWPVPDEQTLSRAYASSYYGEGATKFGGPIERLRDWASSGRARAFLRGLPRESRILDVGCGDGRLLRQLKALAPESSVHGIELPGSAANRAATVPEIHLHLGTLATANYEPESFDLITLVHVIEHLPDPRAALEKVVSWLKPGGRLFLAFPNIASWQARWFGPAWFHLDPPRHLTLVPPESFSTFLASRRMIVEKTRHWCPEQNLYGWLQSVLNRFDRNRNLLYERLKRNWHYASERRLAGAVHAAVAGLLAPAAVLIDAAAAVARAGATVEITYRRNTGASRTSYR